MALIKTGCGISEIRGKFGGVYFKKDTSGQHIQSQARHVIRPASGLQGPMLKSFTFVSNLAKLFNTSQIAIWYNFAMWMYSIGWSLINWRMWFLQANVKRNARGLEIKYDPYEWYDFYRYVDYNVQNEGGPPYKKVFSEEGNYNTRPFYGEPDRQLFIWCAFPDAWYISEFPGTPGNSGWKLSHAFQRGSYEPYGTATGFLWVWGKGRWKYIPD